MNNKRDKFSRSKAYRIIMSEAPEVNNLGVISSLIFHGVGILKSNLPKHSSCSQVKNGTERKDLSESDSIKFASKIIAYGERGLDMLYKARELNDNLGYAARFSSAIGIAYENIFRKDPNSAFYTSPKWYKHQFNAGRFFMMDDKPNESVYCLRSSLDSILSIMKYMKNTKKFKYINNWNNRFDELESYVQDVSQDFVSGEKNALELQRMHKRVENTLLRHDF